MSSDAIKQLLSLEHSNFMLIINTQEFLWIHKPEVPLTGKEEIHDWLLDLSAKRCI